MRRRVRAGRSSRRRNEIIDEISSNFVRMEKKIDDAIRSRSSNAAVARRAGRAARTIDCRSRHRAAAVAVAWQPRELKAAVSAPLLMWINAGTLVLALAYDATLNQIQGALVHP